jgi:hypothetical protein
MLDPACEPKEEVDAGGGGDVGEHCIQVMEWSDVCLPMCPIADPLVVIHSHDPSIDISPCSSEKIIEFSLNLWKEKNGSEFGGNVSQCTT